MSDIFSKKKRSQIMASIKSHGNISTEIKMANLFKGSKLSGWRRGSLLPGKPDFIFLNYKIAIFIDGDFWHGNPHKYKSPKTRTQFWDLKIEANRTRDKNVNRRLRKLGWKVLRIWESSLKKKPEKELLRVKRLIIAQLKIVSS